jgi:hypothetical protein
MRMNVAARPILILLIPVLFVVVVGSVVIFQRRAAPIGEPVGDRGVQVPADDIPRSAGGGTSRDGLTAWVSAAAVGDFATARRHMEDDSFLYNVWEGSQRAIVDHITSYRIISKKTVGQTTTATVRFDRRGFDPTCITVQVDEVMQKVRVDRGFGPCPAE